MPRCASVPEPVQRGVLASWNSRTFHRVMTIDPNTRIGHVHLTVSDLDRALRFYRDVLGFEVTTTYGRDAVFLAAGGYHHHIGLNTWAGRGAPQPAPGTTGLYHFAILYPDRRALATALHRVLEAGGALRGGGGPRGGGAVLPDGPGGQRGWSGRVRPRGGGARCRRRAPSLL